MVLFDAKLSSPSSPIPTSGGRKYITVSSSENSEIPSALLLAIISGAVLLLYSLSRIIALHRRVKDLESRPPVDDIALRGLIRQQLNGMVNEETARLKQRDSVVEKANEPSAAEKSAEYISFSDSEKVVEITPPSTPLTKRNRKYKSPPALVRKEPTYSHHPYEDETFPTSEEEEEEKEEPKVLEVEVPLVKKKGKKRSSKKASDDTTSMKL